MINSYSFLFPFCQFFISLTHILPKKKKKSPSKKLIAACIISGPNADEWCWISEQWSLSPVCHPVSFSSVINRKHDWMQGSQSFTLMFFSTVTCSRVQLLLCNERTNLSVVEYEVNKWTWIIDQNRMTWWIGNSENSYIKWGSFCQRKFILCVGSDGNLRKLLD